MDNLPKSLLQNLYWSFNETTYQEIGDFTEEVRKYNVEIGGSDTFKPNEIVLHISYCNILFEYYEGDEEKEECIRIESLNKTDFTTAEMLFKIHNNLAAKDLGDHIFFEGLTLLTDKKGEIPTYALDLGS
ncbi:MAG: hypothetical protein WBP45_02495 [Daejeonella sp.]